MEQWAMRRCGCKCGIDRRGGGLLHVFCSVRQGRKVRKIVFELVFWFRFRVISFVVSLLIDLVGWFVGWFIN